MNANQLIASSKFLILCTIIMLPVDIRRRLTNERFFHSRLLHRRKGKEAEREKRREKLIRQIWSRRQASAVKLRIEFWSHVCWAALLQWNGVVFERAAMKRLQHPSDRQLPIRSGIKRPRRFKCTFSNPSCAFPSRQVCSLQLKIWGWKAFCCSFTRANSLFSSTRVRSK